MTRKTPSNVRSEDTPEYLRADPPPDTNTFGFPVAVAHEDAAISYALRVLRRRLDSRSTGPLLPAPGAVKDYLRLLLADLEHEVFGLMYLSNQHRLIERDELFRGTIDGAAVYPREVVKAALAHNAAAVILYHNHPSGLAEPSQADQRLTQRLKVALGTVDIRVLDHLIVGGMDVVSFAERGLL